MHKINRPKHDNKGQLNILTALQLIWTNAMTVINNVFQSELNCSLYQDIIDYYYGI